MYFISICGLLSPKIVSSGFPTVYQRLKNIWLSENYSRLSGHEHDKLSAKRIFPLACGRTLVVIWLFSKTCRPGLRNCSRMLPWSSSPNLTRTYWKPWAGLGQHSRIIYQEQREQVYDRTIFLSNMWMTTYFDDRLC